MQRFTRVKCSDGSENFKFAYLILLTSLCVNKMRGLFGDSRKKGIGKYLVKLALDIL